MKKKTELPLYEVFNEHEYCLNCNWLFASMDGCKYCKPRKKEMEIAFFGKKVIEKGVAN